MKDGKFETLVEIWRHLLGGKKNSIQGWRDSFS